VADAPTPPGDDPLGDLDLGAPAPAAEEESLFGETEGGFAAKGGLGADAGFGGASEYEEPSAPGESESASESGGLDLDAELGDLFGAQSVVAEPPADGGGSDLGSDLGDAGLADIFKEFKKGVDKQLGKEDYDTRYNLGIAYKEMGLIDEAVAEFELALEHAAGPRAIDGLTMLGLCEVERGHHGKAIEHFQRGLELPELPEMARRSLTFELGAAFEAAGKSEDAVGQYMIVSAEDAKFRDVLARIDRLGGPRAVPAVARPAAQRTAAPAGLKTAAQSSRPAPTAGGKPVPPAPASDEPPPEPARKNRKIGFV